MTGKLRFVVVSAMLAVLALLWLVRPSPEQVFDIQSKKLLEQMLPVLEERLLTDLAAKGEAVEKAVPASKDWPKEVLEHDALRRAWIATGGRPVSISLKAEVGFEVPARLAKKWNEGLDKYLESFADKKAPEQRRSIFQKSNGAADLVFAFDGKNQAELRAPPVAVRPAGDLRIDPVVMRTAEFSSLLPPFLTILIAVLIAKTIPALLAGIALGSVFVAWLPQIDLNAASVFAERYVWEKVIRDSFRVDILGFVAALIVAVGIMTRAGGIEGLVKVIQRLAKTARSSQLATYFMGLAIFFDDYANTIVVGSTMRPLTDRMRISREKLAYIVDSTAAPIAGISMLSTWVAYEISTFSGQLPEVTGPNGQPMSQGDGFAVFLETIPYRFYCIFTLFLVAMTIVLRREYGPMLSAERRARREGKPLRDGATPMVSRALTETQKRDDAPARWWNAVIPIGALIVVTLAWIWKVGGGVWFWGDGKIPLTLSPTVWREVLGNAGDSGDSAAAIFYGAGVAALLAAALALGQRILGVGEVVMTSLRAMSGLFFAIAILVLAWCIGAVCDDLGTASYLVALTKGTLPALLLPVILFVIACIVAFATGSSWSTMAILLPIVVLLASELGKGTDLGGYMLMILSIGAVLEGSIFGDHCSPISDTTVLSSVASASDHLDHVQTQIPYAMLAMIVSIGVGYLPMAFISPKLWPVSLALGAAVIIAFLLWRGRDPEAQPEG